jgi:transposase
MTSVETLDDTQRAVVQLLLKQGKSYREIADLLGIDADAVRARAHAALDALGPATAGLTASRRAEVADYLLGQQPDDEREATRDHLAESPAARAWARSVAAELRPLAGGDLPDIPEARDTTPDEDEDGGEPLREGGRGRSSRLGGILLLVGVAVVAAVVVILLVSGGGDDSGTTSTSASTSTPSQQQQQPQQQATPVAQINLKPARGYNAVGYALVLAGQGGDQRILRIVGQHLLPSTKSRNYAVWLYSSPTNAKLMGFVDPAVGSDGQFQNDVAVPRSDARYRELVVTAERSNPKRPGQIVLRGPLTLKF